MIYDKSVLKWKNMEFEQICKNCHYYQVYYVKGSRYEMLEIGRCFKTKETVKDNDEGCKMFKISRRLVPLDFKM